MTSKHQSEYLDLSNYSSARGDRVSEIPLEGEGLEDTAGSGFEHESSYHPFAVMYGSCDNEYDCD